MAVKQLYRSHNDWMSISGRSHLPCRYESLRIAATSSAVLKVANGKAVDYRSCPLINELEGQTTFLCRL
jgi:hypothetical protein